MDNYYTIEIYILGHVNKLYFSNFKEADNKAKEIWDSYKDLTEEEKSVIFVDIKKIYTAKCTTLGEISDGERYAIIKEELKKTYRREKC